MAASTLVEATNYLNAHISGRTLNEARAVISARLRKAQGELDELAKSLVDQGLATWAGAGHNQMPQLIVRGRGNLLENIDAQDDLARLRSLPRGFERSRHAGSLLDILLPVYDIPKEDLPQPPRPRRSPEGTSAAAELLKLLLKVVSEQEGVAGKVIATSDDLERIAADDDADVPALRGWRRRLFGDMALELKKGQIALGFENRTISVIELE